MDELMEIDRYICIAGHVIPSAEIEAKTSVVLLDAGARVRICREHGAPIAETRSQIRAGETSTESHGVPGDRGSGPRSEKPDPSQV